ncbi:MAG: DUF1573 domain-containing protein [Candidatus Hodarchaeales archaeon]|jgi:hypothetical protein
MNNNSNEIEINPSTSNNESKITPENEIGSRKEMRISRRSFVLLFSSLFVVLLLLGITTGLLLLPSENENDEKVGNLGPRIRIVPGSMDFGTVPQVVLNQTFKIENVGDKTLNITSISTSCGCTSVVLVIDGEQSPGFGRSNNPEDWIGSIDAGKNADLIVSYDAGLHPDLGHVKRVVFIKSNDPSLPEAKVTITANVND